MTVEEIERLMKDFKESGLGAFTYENGEEKLKFRAQGDAAAAVLADRYLAAENSRAAAPATLTGTENEEAVSAEVQKNASAETADLSAGDKKPVEGTTVTTPLAGVFYRASKPGEKPFVEEGQAVKKGDTVGLIEAMKMISEIPAPCDGIVRDIRVKDATFVQFGTELMTIGEQ